MRKTAIAIASCLILAASTAHARGPAVGVATEWTQLANNGQLLSIYAENVAQMQQMLQQYANMVQHTQGLSQQMWPSISVQIGDLVNTIAAVEGAANASMGAIAQFDQHYRFDDALSSREQIQNWRTGFRNQTAAALQAMGANAARFQSTQSALEQVQAMSQSAVGRMQVLQAANQIAGMTVNEIQSLHGTIVAAEQARLNYKATEVREREERERAQRDFMQDPGRRFF